MSSMNKTTLSVGPFRVQGWARNFLYAPNGARAAWLAAWRAYVAVAAAGGSSAVAALARLKYAPSQDAVALHEAFVAADADAKRAHDASGDDGPDPLTAGTVIVDGRESFSVVYNSARGTLVVLAPYCEGQGQAGWTVLVGEAAPFRDDGVPRDHYRVLALEDAAGP